MNLQRYVSRELTHFVGRAASTDEARYATLAKILREGLLCPRPDRPDDTTLYHVDLGRWVSSNDLYLSGVVCFCDIPIEQIAIHMAKYSRFGLAFDKAFLVEQGANPVFYVARNSRVRSLATNEPELLRNASILFSGAGRDLANPVIRKDYFDLLVEVFDHFFQELEYLAFSPDSSSGAALRSSPHLAVVNSLRTFIELHLLSFLKFFDDRLTDEEVENYYMEREWRVLGNVRFDISDVVRVILPTAFARMFRKDFPEYFGQVSFAD